ncbi:hypothetical protein GGQ84_000102 [Desulfitispora alkaliphila]|uniref:Fe-S-containing protein n=1 Tax=Desulfitispora alkaliphila TaxID=622674 RepID=UPI003D1E5611
MGDKKQEFMDRQKGNKGMNRVVIGVVIFVVLFGLSAFALINNSTDTAVGNRWEGGDFNLGSEVDYSDQIVPQAQVDLEVEAGQALIQLNQVEENKFIYTQYQHEGVTLPLMAHIAPSGRLVVSISYCEPCRSQSFHINGSELVCDSCNTRWDLASMEGIVGACTDYAPEEIDYQVADGKIAISEDDIRSWTPRSLSGAEG